MTEELNRIIEVVNSSNWNQNKKIRYIYIEIGKLIYKDVMFFYTIQNRLLTNKKNTLQYSISKIDEIMNTDDLFDYKVVCKTSADMLGYVFRNCNINYEIKRTTSAATYYQGEKNVTIQHYFVAVQGDHGKMYALTLNPDLPNIQIGRMTVHFGNNIPYIKETIKKDEDGNEIIERHPQYEGKEIEFTEIDREELKQIDEELGYLNDSIFGGEEIKQHYTDLYFEIIKKAFYQDKFYQYEISRDTDFYYDLCQLCNGDKTFEEIYNDKGKKKINKSELYLGFDPLEKTEKEWDDIKLFILFNIILRLYSELPDIDPDQILKENFILFKENNYEDIFNMYKDKLFQTGIDHTDLNKMKSLNPLHIMKTMKYLFREIDDFVKKENKTHQDIVTIKENFLQKINAILLLFVDKESVYDNLTSNQYITDKTIYSFTKIFDIGNKTEFNKMHLAEQLVIIKEVLELIFKDLDVDRTSQGYDEQKSAIKNRTLTTVIFEKRSKKPYYLLCAKTIPKFEEDKISYRPILYDLSENKLITAKTMLDIWNNYYIIKDDDVRLMIENIELQNMFDNDTQTNSMSTNEATYK